MPRKKKTPPLIRCEAAHTPTTCFLMTTTRADAIEVLSACFEAAARDKARITIDLITTRSLGFPYSLRHYNEMALAKKAPWRSGKPPTSVVIDVDAMLLRLKAKQGVWSSLADEGCET